MNGDRTHAAPPVMSLRLAHALYREASHEATLLGPQLACELQLLALHLERGTVQAQHLYRTIWNLLTYLFESVERRRA